MIRDDLPSLFAYNRWANGRMLEAVRTLTPEQYVQEPAPGWASVRSTLVHMAGATRLWARVLRGETSVSRIEEAECPTFADVERLFEEGHDAFDGLLAEATPETLASLWDSKDLRGNPRRFPFWAAYRHVANHATYHRGQVASKLKRLGVEPPFTDLVLWAMEQVPQP